MLYIDRIKSRFAHALRRGCSEKRCTLRLQGLGNYAVLNGERICPDRKMCDCIIFVANGSVIIGIVELKSKTAHSSDIAEKLTNSSETALDILQRCADSGVDFRLCHLALSKKWKTIELRKIRKERVRIRGKVYSIITKRCGVSFSTVISEFGK
jgi:hypothetical protein